MSETGNLHAKTLLLLKPRGFCAGVVRAIDIVRIALEAFGRPIYVRKECTMRLSSGCVTATGPRPSLPAKVNSMLPSSEYTIG